MECLHCDYMKKENKRLVKNRDEMHKNYVEVVNENLALRRELESLKATG